MSGFSRTIVSQIGSMTPSERLASYIRKLCAYAVDDIQEDEEFSIAYDSIEAF
jgi:SET domain-containing protein